MSSKLENISNALIGIFTELPIKRFLIWFIIIFFITIIIFGLVEIFTGYLFFTRLNNKIDAVEKLDDIYNKNHIVNKELESIINSISEDIKNYNVAFNANEKQREVLLFDEINSTDIKKFISGISLWILLLFVLIFHKQQTDRKLLIVFCVFFGIISGFVSVYLPTIYSLWINGFGFPIVLFIFLYILSKIIKS
jgi:hypothetical protein